MLRPLPVFVLAVASMTMLESQASPTSEPPVCTVRPSGLCAMWPASVPPVASGLGVSLRTAHRTRPQPIARAPGRLTLPLPRLAQAESGEPAGGYRVQLAAYRTRRGAQHAWRRLVGAHPDLLAALDVSIERADLGTNRGVVFQVRVGPFPETSAAHGLCRELKSRGTDCFVVRSPILAGPEPEPEPEVVPKDRPLETPDAAGAATEPSSRPSTAGSIGRGVGTPAPIDAGPEGSGDRPAPTGEHAEQLPVGGEPIQAEATSLAGAAEPEPPAMMGEISGFIAPELRIFPKSAQFSGQEGTGVSFAIQPEYDVEWDDGRQNLGITAFARVDQLDDRRTHFDLREFRWQYAGDGWDLRLGVDKVFWGTVESNHLVDIINQTDLIENPDMEDKLGQPMVNLSLIQDWGIVEFFYLPYFRERTFPGTDGRLRTFVPIDVDREDFEADAEELHPDWAVRWSQSFDAWDVGIAHFYGTSREPRFLPSLDGAGNLILVPRYDLINQTSLDAQGAVGDTLLKLEAMTRSGHGDRIFAFTGGGEYTVYGVAGSSADVGLLLEVSYDDRNDDGGTTAPPVIFDNDVFTGLRFSLNDVQATEILAGVAADWRSGARAISVEASRRIGDRAKLSLEARIFDGFPREDFFSALRRDDFVQFEFSYFF